MKFSKLVRILEKNGFSILKEKGLSIPKENKNPEIIIRNEKKLKIAV